MLFAECVAFAWSVCGAATFGWVGEFCTFATSGSCGAFAPLSEFFGRFVVGTAFGGARSWGVSALRSSSSSEDVVRKPSICQVINKSLFVWRKYCASLFEEVLEIFIEVFLAFFFPVCQKSLNLLF